MGDTQYEVIERLGDDLVVRIDPRTIDGHVGGQRPATKRIDDAARALLRPVPVVRGPVMRRLRRRHPFVIPGRRFPEPFPIEQVRRYAELEDYLTVEQPREESAWYRMLLEQLADWGYGTSNRMRFYSREEIDRFFDEYVDPLIESLRRDGFREELAEDFGKAMVDAHGKVHKSSSGNHRFVLCRILGVSPVPLRIIGVHQDWLDTVGVRDLGADLPAALQVVERRHR